MFRELKIKVGTLEKKLYLRTGVERFSNHVSTIHKHRAAEVHVISAGTVSFLVEGKAYTVRAGEVFVVPPLQTHMCSSASEENRYANFYVEVPLDAPLRFGAGPGIAEAFIRQCEESQKQEDYTKLAAFLLLLCCEFCRWDTATVETLSDRGVVIDDYFANKYVDGTLSDLAGELCLSEKQTERLVRQRTGMTFRQNISRSRIQAAQLLLRGGAMTGKEIAEYVGYASYAGYYKAMRAWEKSHKEA